MNLRARDNFNSVTRRAIGKTELTRSATAEFLESCTYRAIRHTLKQKHEIL
ncbi:hypothetical protein KIS4809_3477 [Bacillus sp. ZZV12-4809]|nr:hypothetical protein KIS4809_3477 [Bacillus sp. ZZV12-4809]